MKQLTAAFPTEESFINAYGQGSPMVKLTLKFNESSDYTGLQLNGKYCLVDSSDTLIGFEWKPNVYRIPGIGFKNKFEVNLI